MSDPRLKPLHLHLALKHKYYNQIERGEKKVEYRDNTLYWRVRIVKPWCSNGGNTVTFHRGYTNTTMTFKISSLVINGDKIELHLGERIEGRWWEE